MNRIINPKAVLAGVLIGIGDIAFISVDDKVIGSLLFAVALLSIIQLKLPLYTGRIGFCIHKGIEEFSNCLCILVANCIGVAFVSLSYYGMHMDGIDKLIEVSELKFSHDYFFMLIAGIMCNVLIHIAVSAKREIITVLCIMAFILCGFEHSVADVMYSIVAGLTVMNPGIVLLKWITIVIGNTIGGLLTQGLIKNEA
jgi:formate/nitrite transporter FocA (FNT family)